MNDTKTIERRIITNLFLLSAGRLLEVAKVDVVGWDSSAKHSRLQNEADAFEEMAKNLIETLTT